MRFGIFLFCLFYCTVNQGWGTEPRDMVVLEVVTIASSPGAHCLEREEPIVFETPSDVANPLAPPTTQVPDLQEMSGRGVNPLAPLTAQSSSDPNAPHSGFDLEKMQLIGEKHKNAILFGKACLLTGFMLELIGTTLDASSQHDPHTCLRQFGNLSLVVGSNWLFFISLYKAHETRHRWTPINEQEGKSFDEVIKSNVSKFFPLALGATTLFLSEYIEALVSVVYSDQNDSTAHINPYLSRSLSTFSWFCISQYYLNFLHIDSLLSLACKKVVDYFAGPSFCNYEAVKAMDKIVNSPPNTQMINGLVGTTGAALCITGLIANMSDSFRLDRFELWANAGGRVFLFLATLFDIWDPLSSIISKLLFRTGENI